MWLSSAWSKRGEAGWGFRWPPGQGSCRGSQRSRPRPDPLLPHTRDLPALGIMLAGHQKKLLHNVQLLQQHLRGLGSVEV